MCGYRKLTVPEAQGRQWVRGDHLQPFGDFQTLGIGIHEERGQSLGSRSFTRADKDGVEICDAAVGNPSLATVDDEVVAFPDSSGCEVGNIRSSVRFREREGCDFLASAHSRKVIGFLFVCAEKRDRPAAESLHRKGEIRQTPVPRQCLPDQAEGAHVQCFGMTAIRFRNAPTQPACLGQLFDECAGSVIHFGNRVRMARLELAGAPHLQFLGEGAVLFGEERPVEEAAVRHQLPSKAGRCLATNAS